MSNSKSRVSCVRKWIVGSPWLWSRKATELAKRLEQEAGRHQEARQLWLCAPASFFLFESSHAQSRAGPPQHPPMDVPQFQMTSTDPLAAGWPIQGTCGSPSSGGLLWDAGICTSMAGVEWHDVF